MKRHPVSGAPMRPRHYVCAKCGTPRIVPLTDRQHALTRTLPHPCPVCGGSLVRASSKPGKRARKRAAHRPPPARGQPGGAA